MGIEYQFRPIEQWPAERTKSRKRSTFSASWTRTITDLARELQHLGARNIVLQAAVRDDEIRNDGMLRSSARPSWPGVIVAFDSKHGPLSYPCDTYTDWQANVRAIALALAALRAVDRYGVTRRAEQYKGWAKLPGPIIAGEPTMTVEFAAIWLMETGGGDVMGIKEDADSFQSAYRRSLMATHPDKGGSQADFLKTQRAKEILSKHHGVTP